MEIKRPAPIPCRETRYGLFYVETADVYSDGRRENVKRTPYWKLDDDENEDDEQQAERRSVYCRDYTVNHRPQ